MYATKRINKNKIDVSYISIQDPYVENRKLPPRWKEKQFAVAHLPNPENGGYFAKKTYAPDPYKEAVHFIKEQPADSRKLGFGTKDASKRGEFTATIRTEQYRETLKKEQRILDHQRDPAAETMTLERARKREEERSFPEGLSETRRLYDIGRQNGGPDFLLEGLLIKFKTCRPNEIHVLSLNPSIVHSIKISLVPHVLTVNQQKSQRVRFVMPHPPCFTQ